MSSEYQPSPLAALESVCGPQPSGTAHPLHREKEGDKEKTHEQHSTAQASLEQRKREEKSRRLEKERKKHRRHKRERETQRAELMQ